MFEYGGKRNSQHIKKPRNNIHQVKGERRRKRRICLQSIFIFYEFIENSFLKTCFSSNTTQD